MIRTFISVMPDGTVTRHEEPPMHLVRRGAVAIIEVAPKMAQAEVGIFLVDEDGDRMDEIE